nr:transposase family protein [Deinococcus betulae]
MEAVLVEREAAKKKSGRPAALSPAEQLLLTLEFWREYRTFAHLGDDWGVHETTVQRSGTGRSGPDCQWAVSSPRQKGSQGSGERLPDHRH